jgi:hypothetical protein
MQKTDMSQCAITTVVYESPRLTTYGDLKNITKGTLAGTADTSGTFKP